MEYADQLKTSGKDNCAWYRFDVNNEGVTKFHGRR